MSSLERLKKIKSVLESKKQERARVEGQLEAANTQLNELGYKSVTEAEKGLEKMDKELDKLDNQINDTLAELETKYANLLG